jgi:hypothetical protein
LQALNKGAEMRCEEAEQEANCRSNKTVERKEQNCRRETEKSVEERQQFYIKEKAELKKGESRTVCRR